MSTKKKGRFSTGPGRSIELDGVTLMYIDRHLSYIDRPLSPMGISPVDTDRFVRWIVDKLNASGRNNPILDGEGES